MPTNNYNTLHKDIELTEKDYGLWDINFQNGDLKSATDKNSLRTGLIIACLTSWNYLNKKGNTTYETFGNHAYEELKKKKSNMVKYKIQQYFIEVLNRIRRVQNVETLEVYEVENYPNDYFVKFTVIALNDETIKGSFNITTDLKQQDSQIKCTALMPFATNRKPLKIELQLCNEYGTGIADEILYIYTKEHDETEYKFYKITDPTDNDGYLRLEYTPKKRQDNNYGETSIKFVFRGNTTHNGCESLPISFNTDYIEYRLSFITEDFTTLNETESIIFKLEEISQRDNQPTPTQNETVYIKGDDGSLYETVTNSEGVGKCEVLLKQTTTYTASYGTSIKDTLTITIQQGDIQINVLEEPSIEYYADTPFSFKLQLVNDNNKTIKKLPFTIKKNNETVATGQTNNEGVIYYTANNTLGQSTWAVTTTETPFYNQKTITFTTETIKYSPLMGLNVQKSPNSKVLHLTFDYEYEEDDGYLLFSDIPNEQIRLSLEEDKIKVDFHKIEQYYEWKLMEEGIHWDEQNSLRFIVEETILTDTVSYQITLTLTNDDVNDETKDFFASIPKTGTYTSFDNLIYEKSSNITNISNQYTLTCFTDESLLLESKVCHLPLLSNEKVHFYANNIEIGNSQITNGKANLTYTFDGWASGTYDLQAKINSTENSNETESYKTTVTVIEHDYSLNYSQINNNTIQFTFTDWGQPVKNKKVRLYSEETGYEKALYTDDDGTCTFTNVIYGGLYSYTCETFNGTIQNGTWVNLLSTLRTSAKVHSGATRYSFNTDTTTLTLTNSWSNSVGYTTFQNVLPLNSSYELEVEMSGNGSWYGLLFGDMSSTMTGINIEEDIYTEEQDGYLSGEYRDGRTYLPIPESEWLTIDDYTNIKLKFKVYSDNQIRCYYNSTLLREWALNGDDLDIYLNPEMTLTISKFRILYLE